MSDNIKRTELLTQLFEQQLITADQLSRAKLYLQFISGTAFDSQDSAIDWLLENRIINERPVTETVPIEQNTELSSKEPEIEPEIQAEPEENISESVDPDEISEEIPTQKEPEASQEQSVITESVAVEAIPAEHVEKENIIEQPQLESTSSPQEAPTTPTESAQSANPLELLILLYMAGTINDKELKKAKKELALNPQIDFKNSDQLLIWLEQKDIIKPEPVKTVQPKKNDIQRPIPIVQPANIETTSTVKQPPSIQSTSVKKKKGGCLKKLIFITVGFALIGWYFTPEEAPVCDSEEAHQEVVQSFAATYYGNNRPSSAPITKNNHLLSNAPVVYRFSSATNLTQTFYEQETRQRTCKATITYKASGNDETAIDIVREIAYRVMPISHNKFSINVIAGKDEIIKKVIDENDYYRMLNEKDKTIKAAFIQGLAQVEQFINNTKYSQSKLSAITKNIRWVNVIGECQQVEDTQYSCPIEFGYRDNSIIMKEIRITLDMPVLKKDDHWEPTDKFYDEFFKVYVSALKEVITTEKADKKENDI